MTRIQLPRGHELRAIHRRAQIGRGNPGSRESVMIALYQLNTQIGGGTISVPVALFADFQRAVAALSIDDLNPSGTFTPSGGVGATGRGLAASALAAHRSEP